MCVKFLDIVKKLKEKMNQLELSKLCCHAVKFSIPRILV